MEMEIEPTRSLLFDSYPERTTRGHPTITGFLNLKGSFDSVDWTALFSALRRNGTCASEDREPVASIVVAYLWLGEGIQ